MNDARAIVVHYCCYLPVLIFFWMGGSNTTYGMVTDLAGKCQPPNRQIAAPSSHTILSMGNRSSRLYLHRLYRNTTFPLTATMIPDELSRPSKSTVQNTEYFTEY